jgi:hypothetical protein
MQRMQILTLKAPTRPNRLRPTEGFAMKESFWTTFLIIWFLPYILVRWGIKILCDILDEEERR